MKDNISYSVIQFYTYFFKKNKLLIVINALMETIVPITEINLYRILTEEILDELDIGEDSITISLNKNNKFQRIMNDLLHFFYYFLIIIVLKFINKIIVNLILPEFRITSRKMILENFIRHESGKAQNTSLVITLNAMPMALYNVYKSVLKFILPLVVLHLYICYSIYILGEQKIFLLVFLFCILNIASIANMIFYQSKLSSEVWSSHGYLVEEYNLFYANSSQDKQNLDKIEKHEKEFEEKRFRFYKNLNFIIYTHMFVFMFFSFSIIYMFYHQSNISKTKKVITLFLFSGKYFATVLHLCRLTIDSFGRIRILNESLEKNLN